MIQEIFTNDWIKENKPCAEFLIWWDKKERDFLKLLRLMIKNKQYKWANWFITKLLTKKDNIKYAIYAAELVLPVWEAKFPADDRPRKAIKIIKSYLIKPTIKAKKEIRKIYNIICNPTPFNPSYSAGAAYRATAHAVYTVLSDNYVTSALCAALCAACTTIRDDYVDTINNATFRQILNYGLALLEQE